MWLEMRRAGCESSWLMQLPALRSKRQHVPLQKYRELLQSTVRHLASCGAGARVIITPPPIDEPARIASRKEVSDSTPSEEHCGSNKHAGDTPPLQSASYLTAVVKWGSPCRVRSGLWVQKWGINEFSEQPDRLNAVTGDYAAACRAVGAEEGVPVLDIWTGDTPTRIHRCSRDDDCVETRPCRLRLCIVGSSSPESPLEPTSTGNAGRH